MVLQFGQVRAVKEEPGLGFKIPFIQNVVYYDGRIQAIETASLEVTPLDDRRLIVDAFARWRIADVEQFRRAVGAGGMQVASQRLESILNANVREVLGSVRSEVGAVGRPRRADEPHPRQRDRRGARARRRRDRRAAEARRPAGAEPRGDLRAHAGRAPARGGRRARARGNEAAQRVRAQADRTAIEIVSEAQRDADIIRGEADAERNAILATSFGADEEFFAFIRSMQAYRSSLTGENTDADGRAGQRVLQLPQLAGLVRGAPRPRRLTRRRRASERALPSD